MHIGKSQNKLTCPDLKVDGWIENNVTSVETGKTQMKDIFKGTTLLEDSKGEKYLGDIISSDGKNYKTVAARKNKGTGIVNELFALIVELSLGHEHFETAILLRNTVLISSLKFNSQAWYGVRKKKVRELEKIDEQFLRKKLQAVHLKHQSPYYILNSGFSP